jgi:hypothetical protein
MKNSVPFS